MNVAQLSTPALIIDSDALDHNLRIMAAARPGPLLRPHVKAHKCSSLAAAQAAVGHRSFTCATVREMIGMADAGLGDDLLLANEVIDSTRLAGLAAAQDRAMITVALDSDETVDAAAQAGIHHALIDVNIGLPRCGCRPDDAARLADRARGRGIDVRGVMGYEGHLMVMDDSDEQRSRVDDAVERLVGAHEHVGGDVISAGGTGTYHLHHRVTEVQAGSYALMDSYYAQLGHPFIQACFVVGTVVSVSANYAVADVGLKAMGMDHGNPTIAPCVDDAASSVWFLSDEHVTFAPATPVRVGDQIRVIPAHIDPTMAMHDVAWLVHDGEVIDRWPIDLRGW